MKIDLDTVLDTTDGVEMAAGHVTYTSGTVNIDGVAMSSVWETPHSEEIAELKKEIQELKDMISEHILLGHSK